MPNEGYVTLRDKLSRGPMLPLQVMDTALLLGQWMSDDEYSNHRELFDPLSPDSIVFDDMDRPSVRPRSDTTAAQDLAYYSPQFAMGQAESSEGEDWYSLGLIIYHMMTGKLLYEQLPEGVFTQAGSIDKLFRLGLFQGYDKAMVAAVFKMFDEEPSARGNGFEEFTDYLLQHVPGSLEVEGTCGEQRIRLSEYQFDPNNALEYKIPARIAINGVPYATDAPVYAYRPGRHCYRVVLRRLDNENSSHAGVGRFTGRWLFTNAQDKKWAGLICVDDPTACTYDIPIVTSPEGCVVALIEAASGSNRVLNRWCVAQASGAAIGYKCILRFTRPANSQIVTLSLLNLEKTRKLTNDVKIDMDQR